MKLERLKQTFIFLKQEKYKRGVHQTESPNITHNLDITCLLCMAKRDLSFRFSVFSFSYLLHIDGANKF